VAQKKAKQEPDCDPPVDKLGGRDFAEDLAALAKALGHPARVRILSLLVKKGVCVSGDLADELPLAPSTVSEHVRILRESGLIRGTVDGPRRSYCANREALADLSRLVMSLCQSGQVGEGQRDFDC
jgi:ArsR family transcriptional regulator